MSDSEGTRKGGSRAFLWLGLGAVLLCGGVGITGVGGVFAWQYYKTAEAPSESAGMLSVVNQRSEPVSVSCEPVAGGDKVTVEVAANGGGTIDVPARPARCEARTTGDAPTVVGAWSADEPPAVDESWTFTVAAPIATPYNVTITSQAPADLTLECTGPGTAYSYIISPAGTRVLEGIILPIECKGMAADGSVVWTWKESNAPADAAAGFIVGIPAEAVAAAPTPPTEPPPTDATEPLPSTTTTTTTTSSTTASTSTTKPTSTTSSSGTTTKPTSTSSSGTTTRPTSTATSSSTTSTTPPPTSSTTTTTTTTSSTGTQTRPADPAPTTTSSTASTSTAMFLLKVDVRHGALLKGATFTVDGKSISVPGQKALSVGSHTLKVYKKDGPAINLTCTVKSTGKDLAIVLDGDDLSCP